MGSGRLTGVAVRLQKHLRGVRQTRQFIDHNRAVWADWKQSGEAEVLCNYDPLAINLVRFSYVMNSLAQMHGAKIRAFVDERTRITGTSNEVYKSFNVDDLVHTQLSQLQKKRAENIFTEIYSGIITKQDVLDVKVAGVEIGVDLYDTYLRQLREPTVRPDDPRLVEFLKRAVGLVIFWQDYLTSHNVRAICLSHDTYLPVMGITKVARQMGIPIYSPDLLGPRARNKPYAAHSYFPDFPNLFVQLSKSEQSRGVAKAKAQLERRFAGELGAGMKYDQASSFSTAQADSRVLRVSEGNKVLICTHEFCDAPHILGWHLFVDFYEWLLWLADFAETTDYDWYIKMHPRHWPVSEKVVSDLIKQHPRIMLVPAATSHHQLVKEGIDVVLTCMGTVGFEYPALGVPVVNAAYNSRIGYDFNYHPRSIKEYEKLLSNVPALKKKFDKQKIYECQYMHRYDELSDQVALGWWRDLVSESPGEDKKKPMIYNHSPDTSTIDPGSPLTSDQPST